MRESLFTDEEIEEDWERYQKIIDLKQVLRPRTIIASNIPQTQAPPPLLNFAKLEEEIMRMPLPVMEEVKSSVDPWIYRDETGQT